jgi:hypothetical protein
VESRRSIEVEGEALPEELFDHVFDVRLSQSLQNFFCCLVIQFPRFTFSTTVSLFFSVLFDLDLTSVALDCCAA